MVCFIREVTERDKAEIKIFAQQHPWKPSYPTSLVNRFLDELISSNHLIFDLHDDGGRIACAVLLDKVNNPSNDACLEIIGVRSDYPPLAVLSKFIELAKTRVPQNKYGFQINVAEAFALSEDFLQSYSLKSYYSTYEMQNPSVTVKPISAVHHISGATKETVGAVYEILCRSFGNNRDTSIPDPKTWYSTFLNSDRSHYYLWHEQVELVGFANLVRPENGDSSEVRTIGVLPSHRGLGIGRDLLRHCLNETIRFGYGKCHLTVAVENEKALGLYVQTGFEVREKFRCYRSDTK